MLSTSEKSFVLALNWEGSVAHLSLPDFACDQSSDKDAEYIGFINDFAIHSVLKSIHHFLWKFE